MPAVVAGSVPAGLNELVGNVSAGLNELETTLDIDAIHVDISQELKRPLTWMQYMST